MRLVALIISVWLNAFQYCKGQHRRGAYSGDDEADGMPKLIWSPDAINIRWHPDEQEYQRARDRFKWSKDGPVWIGTVFAILAFIISFLAFGETQRTTREVARQANIASETLIASQRAWIKADVTMGNRALLFDENGVSFSVAFVLKNIGNAPALHITPHAWAVSENSGPFPWQIQKTECDKFRKERGFTGFSLFPSEIYPAVTGWGSYNVGVNVPLKDLDRVKLGGKSIISIDVVVCVDYTFPSDPDTHHQTGYIFVVGRKNDALFLRDTGVTRIEPDDLILREEILGVGRYAD